MALVARPSPTAKRYIMRIVPRLSLTLVLDSVRSAYNVGAVFRTADCAHIEQVLTCGHTPPAEHPRVRKTALDAELVVRTKHHPTLRTALAELQLAGMQIYAVELTEEAQSIWNMPDDTFHAPTALVFGNEVAGVNLEVTREFGISELSLPQYGVKDSLNVAAAASIVMYHWRYRATQTG